MRKDKIKKAALYARVSTEAQRDEGYSIDAQKEMLGAYCKSKGIKEYEFYIDGGFSGANTERPALQRLVDDIKLGKISSVIVYKLDRLSRSQKDTLYLIEDVLIPNGVDFVSMNENMDTSTPIGRAMLGIMSAFAQLERETIKERTRMGMLERVKSGLWMGGGRVPFGYDYDREKGILVPNKDADTVRDIYSLYLQGYSTLKIAHLTGLKYERLAIQILRRKSNTGSIIFRGVEYKNCHEPIVSEETYNKAMQEMRRREKTGYTGKHLLAGFVYCGVCGSKMRYQKWGEDKYKVYCYSQDPSKIHLSQGYKCDNKKVWASELEEAVVYDIFSLSCKSEGKVNEETDALKVCQMAVNSCKKRLSRLYDLYSSAEDDLLLDEIKRKKEELSRAEQELEIEKEKRKKSKEANEKAKKLGTLSSAWPKMTVDEKRGVLRELVEKIVVTFDNVDIYYIGGSITRSQNS